jgi:hypothetical protein
LLIFSTSWGQWFTHWALLFLQWTSLKKAASKNWECFNWTWSFWESKTTSPKISTRITINF